MGAWYWIGVAGGLGTAAGIALAAVVPSGRSGAGLAAALGIAAGLGLGLLVGGWIEAAVAAVGGFLGALSTVPFVANALRGTGTRLGVAAFVILAALAAAGLAFVPGLGYLELVAAPLVAHRLRKRNAGRYAGLRILAKD
jgi:hypothetical protein